LRPLLLLRRRKGGNLTVIGLTKTYGGGGGLLLPDITVGLVQVVISRRSFIRSACRDALIRPLNGGGIWAHTRRQ
jgi:hypothetical protein